MRFWRFAALLVLFFGCGGKSEPLSAHGPAALTKEQCAEHTECSGASGAKPCSTGMCFSLEGCESAICIDSDEACRLRCGNADCAILESYPAQIACQS